MFGSRDLIGWRSPVGQTLFALAAVGAVLFVHDFLGMKLALYVAAAPIVAYLTLKRPYIVAIVFVCFSYFRLHEAYTFLEPAGIIGLSGAALIAGLIWKIFSIKTEGRQRISELKVLSLTFTMLAVVFLAVIAITEAYFSSPSGFIFGSLALLFFSLAMICWHQIIQKGEGLPWPSAMNYFVIFFVFTAMTVPFSFNPDISLRVFENTWWKIGIVVFSLAWFSQDIRDFGFTLYAILLSGAAIAAKAIYNKIYGIDLVEGARVTIGLMLYAPENPILPLDPLANYASTLGDPNELALVLLFPLGLAGALIFYQPNRVLTALGFLTYGAVVLAILYTQSRGGLLGILTVSGIIGLKVVKSRALLIAAGAVAAIGLFVVSGIGERTTALSAGGGLDESSLGRLYAWQAAVNMFLDNPVTGVGMQNFIEAHLSRYAILLTGFNKAVHSTWFGVLAEGGVPGIVLFVSMFAASMVLAYKSLKKFEALGADPKLSACALGMLSGLGGFAIAGAFLTHGYTWPIYIQVGIVIALSRYARVLEAQAAERALSDPDETSWAQRRVDEKGQNATPSPKHGAFA